jgi:DNA-binding CsgD family transcriptional regulator
MQLRKECLTNIHLALSVTDTAVGKGTAFRAGPRQREVLALLASGRTDAQIALELGISTATVRTYLGRLYRTNGISNRTEAVAVWLKTESITAC